ncbi:ScbA/BarX family gamma-butyrolactone biosynthesis protein [Streptomyces sp. NPDC096136]|uniref:ScbA/BarX family gamma-butyrolactone biosynthesis protein n=1 Tax=Streptomyces sp. NPDC096136 TaxID=3366076 RepID=UPI003824ABE7
MTTAPAAAPVASPAPPAPPSALPALDYSRTVDRLLVHRDALGEVFLTDLQPIDDQRYAAGVQLPRSHAYYGDHLLRPGCYDPLLLLEACRQAALAGAHRFYGVPSDNKFILTHLRLRLDRPQMVVVRSAPIALALRVTIVSRKEREGRVTGLDYEFDLTVGGVVIGRGAVGLRFKTPTGYLTLRLNNRDGLALPSSAAYPVRTPGTPLAPHLVGRANPDNVVLVDTVAAGDTAQALLRIPAQHASMFDHPQDHLPGMVIAEGARQLALFAALDVRGLAGAKTLVTEIDVLFTRFGELEDETVLTARAGGGPESGPGGPVYTQGGVLEPEDADGPDPERVAALQQVPVRVEATQRGESLCVISFVLTRLSS